MSDYISRQAAIDEIKRFKQGAAEWRDEQEECSDIWHRADSAIASALEIGLRVKKLPSEQRWIPCSERLPEEYVDVLVWFEYYRFGEYNRMYSTYGIGDYDAEYDKWWINHESGWRDLHVFAWMPLPEPWKGERP